MTKYLFLFTIGPVQSFIAQARKTRDLYAGSFLLSHLIDFAMVELRKRMANCKFIFPGEEIKSKPNRFIAEIEFDNAKNVGEDLKKSVETEFEKIARAALNSSNLTYKNKANENNVKEHFWKQIKNFLQIYWAAIPLEENNYANTYKELESYLGAIKNTRDFQQLKETGRKCSLCGERNVLFYRLTDKEKEKGGLKERQDGLLKKIYVRREEVIFYGPKDEREEQIQRGEGLCAVCFTKRFAEKYFEYNYVKDFPSTAKIALMDWLDNIQEDAKRDYKDLFNNFDEQLYYEENLRREYLEKYGHFKDEESLSETKKQLKKFYKIKIKDKNNNEVKLGKPPKYYALVMSDGDNMGKWLSGEFLDDKSQLKEFQKAVSKKLSEYADNVKEIIRPPKGKLVYAGGDDVLVFINLNHLFDVLAELREKFPPFEKMGFKVKNNYKSTVSAGVVIAHYKTPLSEVLKWVRDIEHEAKEEGGRDAFAIAVLKHSGEINKTMWRWYADYENEKLNTKLFEELVKELNNDTEGFSNTFIKNLTIEFQKLGEIENDMILKAEIKRLLDHSSQIQSNKEKKKRKVQEWQEKLFNLYIESQTKNNFLSFLNIADFISREVK